MKKIKLTDIAGREVSLGNVRPLPREAILKLIKEGHIKTKHTWWERLGIEVRSAINWFRCSILKQCPCWLD